MGKVKILPTNPRVAVVSLLNALISDQLESSQRLKLKTVKMEQELFDNNDKLKEVSFILVTCYKHCVMVWSLSCRACSKKPFSTHGRGLFSPISKHQEKSLY